MSAFSSFGDGAGSHALHAIRFSVDVQAAPPMCEVVANPAAEGVFHDIPGLGDVSMVRHKPDVVAARLRGIISGQLA